MNQQNRPPFLEGGFIIMLCSTYPCITGRNLYPYIRLGPRGRGEGVDLAPSVTGKGGIRQKKLPDIESALDRRTWC